MNIRPSLIDPAWLAQPTLDRDLHHLPPDDAHPYEDTGTRRYVRGDCPRCRHRQVRDDDTVASLGPCRAIEYHTEHADGSQSYVFLLDPCPWTACPGRDHGR